MFYSKDEAGYQEPLKGIHRKTLVHGDKTLLTEFRLRKGSELPSHRHPHEQSGYLVSGRIRLTIGEESFEVRPGEAWCIPGNTMHKADILEDAVAVEVFAPVRQDYLP